MQYREARLDPRITWLMITGDSLTAETTLPRVAIVSIGDRGKIQGT
jgi:hypothetical protein